MVNLKTEGTMKCTRCSGLMIAEHFYGANSTFGAWTYEGMRCVNCGAVVLDATARVRKTFSWRKEGGTRAAQESTGFRRDDE